jgi:hypothetical protein
LSESFAAQAERCHNKTTSSLFTDYRPTIPLHRLPAVGDNAAMQTEPTESEPPKRKRRWFQFSLRTLMIFTLVCAVGSAWVARRLEQKRSERKAVDVIVKPGSVFRLVLFNLPTPAL